MAKNKRVIPVYYWDANVFTAYIKKEKGRWETIEGLLEDCDNGDCIIWTSTLSIAEVTKGNTEVGKIVPMKTQDKIDALWEPPSKIKLIEVSQIVVKEARNVIRAIHGNQKTGIRSIDAIHLASAIHKEIKEFHTYDTKLPGFAKILDLDIKQPYSNRLPFTEGADEEETKSVAKKK
jgi:predicted nucleic acid-binding protein